MDKTFERLSDNLEGFSNSSRVWIYTVNRPLLGDEGDHADELIGQFAQQWVSHNRQLKAHGGLYEGRFVILVVDESQAGASGCSIDTSVRFLKQLGGQLGVDFFNRMLFSYKSDEGIQTVQRSTFENAISSGQVDSDTEMIDTLVSTKDALISTFIRPLKNSWHVRLVNGVV